MLPNQSLNTLSSSFHLDELILSIASPYNNTVKMIITKFISVYFIKSIIQTNETVEMMNIQDVELV